jgi:hypothetical protein
LHTNGINSASARKNETQAAAAHHCILFGRVIRQKSVRFRAATAEKARVAGGVVPDFDPVSLRRKTAWSASSKRRSGLVSECVLRF